MSKIDSTIKYKIVIILITSSAITVYIYNLVKSHLNISLEESIGITALISLPIAFVLMLISYRIVDLLVNLETRRRISSRFEPTAATERTIAAATNEIIRNLERKSNSDINRVAQRITDKSKDLIENSINEKISSLFDDNLIKTISDKFQGKFTEYTKWKEIENESLIVFDNMMRRSLEKAVISEETSKKYLSYAIWLSTSGVAILSLFVIIHYVDLSLHSVSSVDIYVILLRNTPAASLVILFESLAIIMFRQHTKALEYMRYFSNEATNIDARKISFIATVRSRDTQKIKIIIDKLMDFERNPILNKDQETVETKSIERENRFVIDLTKIMENIVPKPEAPAGKSQMKRT